MDLSFTTRVEGRCNVVAVVGEIDAYSAPELREHLDGLIADGHHHLVIDLRGVGFLDSAGLAVLIAVYNRLQRHDGSVSLVCARESVIKIFRITGMIKVFVFHPGVAEAVAATDPSLMVRAGQGFAAVGVSRAQIVAQVFVSIANALVDGRDALDLHTGLVSACSRVLDVAFAGLLLGDPADVLHLMAASSEKTHDLELFQLQLAEGPCMDCYRTGTALLVPDLAAEAARWPRFAPVAVQAGFVSVHAVPMRLGDTVLGVLGLFGANTGTLNAEDLELAQAFAHVASVALVAGRAVADKTVLAEQLQTALNSRIVLEQAKGILSEVGAIDMEQAFAILRRYSRNHNHRLADTAAAVVSRELPAAVLLAHTRAKAGAAPPP